MKYLLILLLFFTGCTTPVKDLFDIPIPEMQRYNPHHRTVDSVLKFYFTDEAYQAVKDIPAVHGFTMGGSYVPGVNVWSTTLSVITGSDWGRKVVFSQLGLENNGILNVIHEYLHHIDDMTRDGELDLIDPKEFEKQWEHYQIFQPGPAAYVIKFADSSITNLFGIGEWSEHMAYTLQHMFKYGGPRFMKHVYRKVIKVWPQ